MEPTRLMQVIRQLCSDPQARSAFLRHPQQVLQSSGLSAEEGEALLLSRPALAAMGDNGSSVPKAEPLVPWM